MTLIDDKMVEAVARRLCEKEQRTPVSMVLTVDGLKAVYANWPDRLAEVKRTLLIVESLYEIVSADQSTPE